VGGEETSVNLTGWPFLLVVYLFGAACLVGVYMSWSRWPPRLSISGRLFGMLLLMAVGALIAMTEVNRSYGFYTSVSDLIGQPSASTPKLTMPDPHTAAGVDVLTPDWQARGRVAAAHGRGEILTVIFHGAHSKLNHHGLLYLPATYFTGDPARRFAGVELFHGYPGAPKTFLGLLSVQQRLDTEITAGRIPPLVVAIPQVYQGRVSSECVNAGNGPQFETYLATDVPEDVVHTFRLLPGRSWAAMGVSTGGFCATNLALHHPDRYAAAASLSGYFTAGQDVNTAPLYNTARFGRQLNSPRWWVQHRSPVAPALYLFASSGDRNAVAEVHAMSETLRRCCQTLPSVTRIGAGGHNWGVWSAAFAPAIDWLAQYLPPPLAPPIASGVPPEPPAASSAGHSLYRGT
jgi:pimeloyl-ACP methyl ester carboxylesterase